MNPPISIASPIVRSTTSRALTNIRKYGLPSKTWVYKDRGPYGCFGGVSSAGNFYYILAPRKPTVERLTAMVVWARLIGVTLPIHFTTTPKYVDQLRTAIEEFNAKGVNL